MGLRIGTNVASLIAQRSLATVNEKLAANYRRLSTGLRIATAADDPAGLAISERLRAQIRSLGQAKRNALDGVSAVQTGEGALSEVSSILIRLREILVQASNGTVSANDRSALDAELQAELQEIERIGRATEFNGIKLLDGSRATLTFGIGAGITAGIDTIDLSLGTVLLTALGLASIDATTVGSLTTSLGQVDGAIDSISRLRGRFGAAQNRLDSTIRNLATSVENASAAESRIRDLDYASEIADLTRNRIIQQASIAILAQANTWAEAALLLIRR